MMIQYIKAAFKDRINELGDDWLDDVSRMRSLDKVDALTQMVAYPDDILNNDYVNGISADVSLICYNHLPVKVKVHLQVFSTTIYVSVVTTTKLFPSILYYTQYFAVFQCLLATICENVHWIKIIPSPVTFLVIFIRLNAVKAAISPMHKKCSPGKKFCIIII